MSRDVIESKEIEIGLPFRFVNEESKNEESKKVKVDKGSFLKLFANFPAELKLDGNEVPRSIEIAIPVEKRDKTVVELPYKILLAIKKEGAEEVRDYLSLFKGDKEDFFKYSELRKAASTTKKVLSAIIMGQEIYFEDFELFCGYLRDCKIALPLSSVQAVLDRLKREG